MFAFECSIFNYSDIYFISSFLLSIPSAWSNNLNNYTTYLQCNTWGLLCWI